MRRTPRPCAYTIATCLFAVAVGASPSAAQFPIRASGCDFQPGFHLSGLTHSAGSDVFTSMVYAAAIFDDGTGSGPALFAGGVFRSADDREVYGAAKWNGSSWTALPGQRIDHNLVYAMTVFDDGNGPALYLGGNFGLDRWDGATWSSPGGGVGGTVLALAGGNLGAGPRLFVGGSIQSAGSAPVANIAQWNGVSWSSLGSGTSHSVYALTVWNDGGGNKLAAGGAFGTAGGVEASRIAKWNGSAWSALGAGMDADGVVNALLAQGTSLYAGGAFQAAGGVAAANLARWNGSAWSALGAGVAGGGVTDLELFDDGSGAAVFAGGAFTSAGGNPAKGVAKWNGSAWSALGSGIGGKVSQLAQFDDGGGNALYAGGLFTTAGGAGANNIARWRAAAWSEVTGLAGGQGLDGTVRDFAVFDDGGGKELYAIGDVRVPGGAKSVIAAKWNGTSWSELPGHGVVGRQIFTFDDGDGEALYVATGPTNEFNPYIDILKLVDGAWVQLPGAFPPISATAVFDDGSGSALYAAGLAITLSTFGSAIARYDGATWSAVGGGIFGDISALAIFDDGSGTALYAGGRFTTAGPSPGTPAARIAKWNGVAWSQVGVGFDAAVDALAVYDDGHGAALYAAGDFSTPAQGLAKWNGSTWTQVGAGVTGNVRDLAVFDDGAGAALYVTGGFSESGGPSSSHTARWDGTVWTPVGSGPGPGAYRMQVYDRGDGDALFFGGTFTVAGGLASASFAQFCRPGVFQDGFESGLPDAWSQVFP